MAEVFGTVASAIVVAGELQRLVKKIRHYRSKAGRLPTKFFDRVSKYILEHELKDLHLLLLDDMDKVVERALFAVSGLLSTLSQRSEGMRSWQGLELKHRLVSFIRRKGLGTLRDRSEGKGCFEPWVLTQGKFPEYIQHKLRLQDWHAVLIEHELTHEQRWIKYGTII